VIPGPRPPFRGIEWTDALETLPEARDLLATGHLRVQRWLRHRAGSTLLTLVLARKLHSALFEAVWPEFAGRLRGPAPEHMPVNIEFGNHRGEDYERVPEACQALFDHLGRFVTQLDELRDSAPRQVFVEEVLRVAAYAHCELIRIHPFRNGNGRTARIVVNYLAARYGQPSIAYTRPKDEYLDAVRAWLYYRNPEGFMDFLRPAWKP
jgi:fido (protein-threonine AMPylation protein)